MALPSSSQLAHMIEGQNITWACREILRALRGEGEAPTAEQIDKLLTRIDDWFAS